VIPEIVVTRLALRRHLVLRHACDLLPQYSGTASAHDVLFWPDQSDLDRRQASYLRQQQSTSGPPSTRRVALATAVPVDMQPASRPLSIGPYPSADAAIVVFYPSRTLASCSSVTARYAAVSSSCSGPRPVDYLSSTPDTVSDLSSGQDSPIDWDDIDAPWWFPDLSHPPKWDSQFSVTSPSSSAAVGGASASVGGGVDVLPVSGSAVGGASASVGGGAVTDTLPVPSSVGGATASTDGGICSSSDSAVGGAPASTGSGSSSSASAAAYCACGQGHVGDLALAEAAALIVVSDLSLSQFAVSHKLCTMFNADPRQPSDFLRRADLAALTACMTQRLYASRLMRSAGTALCIDPIITVSMAPILTDIAAAAQRPLNIGSAFADDPAEPGTLTILAPPSENVMDVS